jgi:hypothetical protein
MVIRSQLVCVLIVGATSVLGQNVTPSPRLKAVAQDTLEVSFAADEKNLRKLNEIVRQRLSQLTGTYRVNYKVIFSDHSYYDVDSIEAVLQEENPSVRGIISIEMFGAGLPAKSIPGNDPSNASSSGPPLDLQFYANAEVPTINIVLTPHSLSYSVRGASRDWVLNTQADIIDRFHIIVVHVDLLRYLISGFCGVAGIIIPTLIIAISFRKKYDSVLSAADANHKSTSLYKYVFLTSDPNMKGLKGTFLLQMVLLSGLALGRAGYLLGNYLLPESVFVIGDQVAEYGRLLSLRGTLLWGVVVTFVLGVATSVIANLYTSSRRTASSPPS